MREHKAFSFCTLTPAPHPGIHLRAVCHQSRPEGRHHQARRLDALGVAALAVAVLVAYLEVKLG